MISYILKPLHLNRQILFGFISVCWILCDLQAEVQKLDISSNDSKISQTGPSSYKGRRQTKEEDPTSYSNKVDLATNIQIQAEPYNFFVECPKEPSYALFCDLLAHHGGLRYEIKKESSLFQLTFKTTDKNTLCSLSKVGQICKTWKFPKNFSKENAIQLADLVITSIFQTPGFFQSTLVFVSDYSGHNELYLSDFTFKNPIALIEKSINVMHPRWQLNGQSILYTSYKNGFPDIYCIDTKSHRERVLCSYEGFNGGASYSPNGKQLVMVLTFDKVPQICLAEANGSRVRALTRCPGIKTSPIWLDKEHILFAWDEGGQRPQLYQLKIGTTPNTEEKPQKLELPSICYADEPALSPDKRYLLFTSKREGSFQLATLELKTGIFTWITQGPENHVEGAWLADSRHIVCTERTSSSKKLVLCDTRTKRVKTLHCEALKNTSQVDIWPHK